MHTLVIINVSWTKVSLRLVVTDVSYLSCEAMCVAWDVWLAGEQGGCSVGAFLTIHRTGNTLKNMFAASKSECTEVKLAYCVTYETSVQSNPSPTALQAPNASIASLPTNWKIPKNVSTLRHTVIRLCHRQTCCFRMLTKAFPHWRTYISGVGASYHNGRL